MFVLFMVSSFTCMKCVISVRSFAFVNKLLCTLLGPVFSSGFWWWHLLSFAFFLPNHRRRWLGFWHKRLCSLKICRRKRPRWGIWIVGRFGYCSGCGVWDWLLWDWLCKNCWNWPGSLSINQYMSWLFGSFMSEMEKLGGFLECFEYKREKEGGLNCELFWRKQRLVFNRVRVGPTQGPAELQSNVRSQHLHDGMTARCSHSSDSRLCQQVALGSSSMFFNNVNGTT